MAGSAGFGVRIATSGLTPGDANSVDKDAVISRVPLFQAGPDCAIQRVGTDESARRLRRFCARVDIKSRGVDRAEERLGASDFLWRAVRHHQKAIFFYGRLVLEHGVFGMPTL